MSNLLNTLLFIGLVLFAAQVVNLIMVIIYEKVKCRNADWLCVWMAIGAAGFLLDKLGYPFFVYHYYRKHRDYFQKWNISYWQFLFGKRLIFTPERGVPPGEYRFND